MFKTSRALLALALLASCASPGRGGPINSGTGLENLGIFAGWYDYSAADSGHAILTLELRNTSPVVNGGYLTALAFDDPTGRISSVFFVSSNPNFRLLDGNIHAPPFGRFDIGASVSRGFLGGGTPRGGIGVGESATFTFTFLGDDLDELTGQEFFGGSAADPRVSFLARFRGFESGGSDKVPGTGGPPAIESPPPVGAPEPGTLTLAAVALLLTCGRRVWRCGALSD